MNAMLKSGLLGLVLAATTGAGATELGRLFFTPEQRAQLEYRQPQVVAQPEQPAAPTVNGIVQKHGGACTIWLNGRLQTACNSGEYTVESTPVVAPGK